MATFKDLRDQISADLAANAGNLLDTEINEAINAAIEDYENKRFVFNEGRDTSISTVVGQSEYDLPSTVLTVDQVQYLFAGHLYRLQRQTYEWYVEALVNQTAQVGPSNHYTIYERKLFLYPLPDLVTTVTLSGVIRQPNVPLTNDSDSNAWTNEARQLIRARAKMDLFINRLYEPTLAQAQDAIAKDYETKLVADRDALRLIGHARPFRQF